MDSQNRLTNASNLVVCVLLLLISGLFVWWNASSISSVSQACYLLLVPLHKGLIVPQKNEKASEMDNELCLPYQDVDGQAARTKQARKGRSLLSLDGGGIRGLSQIAILYEISNRIMYDLGLKVTPRLCNYFDVICGVGSGGLIAILIGRLGLTVQQAEEEYIEIMTYVTSALVDNTVVDRMLKAIVKKYTGDSETLMCDPDSPTHHCKVFVGVAAAENMSRLVKFRSFQSRQGQESNLPIWQVARASLSHPGLLPSVQLGPELAPVTYMSGELGWNNPSKELIREFEAEWKREGVICFTSIGAGHQGVIQLDTSSVWNSYNSTLEKMATDCQRAAEEIAHRFQGQNNYFRLNVEQGFQRFEGQKPLKPENVVVHTKAYLDSTWTSLSIDRLVHCLLSADEVFPWQTTRDIFEQAIERCLSDTRSCIDGITIDAIKLEALEAVSTLELIREANSNEEEWLELAKAVDDYTTIVARDVIPKIWEPYAEHPLWLSTSKYLKRLRKVHTNTKASIDLHPNQIWEMNTGECLLLKWATDLEKCFEAIQVALSGEVYNQVALSRKRQQGSPSLVSFDWSDMIVEKEREELLSWLSSLRPERRHEDVKAKRSEGTSAWFLNAKTFVAWSAFEDLQNYRALLSFGVPGAGKTTLFSAVVEYLRKSIGKMNMAVVFIYCDYRDRANQTIVGMIGSLAKQLVSQAHSIPAAIWDLYKAMAKEQKSINLETAQTIIKLVLQCFDYVCICLDALDECQLDSRGELLEFLKRLAGTKLRLFVTGRPNVEAELAGFLGVIPTTKIPIVANEEDIRLYLSQKFARDRYPEAMDETLQAQITDKIIEWSSGIFLLSMLQTEAVLEYDTKRDRREALLRIPVGLSETYTATLERIGEQPRARSERAILILTWIYYAERQLRVRELLHALAVKADDIIFDEDGMPSETALVDCCLGLVVIERETSTVRLTHFTLQEYFDEHQDALLPSGHTLLATTCLTYLTFSHTSDVRKLEESSPFIKYAATNVGDHLRKGGDTTTHEKTLSLLNKEDKFSILETFMGRLILGDPLGDSFGYESSRLHWVAFFGVCSVARSLLEAGDDLNPNDKYGETPLSWAAENGHDAVVKLLVSTPGVDLNPSDEYGQTPLSSAARYGRDAVVKLLVSTPGVDLNSNSIYGRTPLSLAAQNGHDPVVKLLVSTPGVELNPSDNLHGQTPLSLAAKNGHDAVVKLLVSTPGVDLNPNDKYGQTPLSLAAQNGRDTVVKLLVSTPGVDLNLNNKYGQTPLSWAT